ncbi:phosphoribosylglycinamide formyltransferase [Paraburkholderia sp. 22099]|mgnify:FL=1|jgi:phosphoribosylglycinamide formyltransferase 1|uniref:Phosphoribosylglycinamide formyltransferase n=1 Tax=Paraburkholderia terricola TaxID=169427 RepID=A0A1M6JFL8_9BURK|nr:MULTISPECIES: phosphoribosylglycinamide formyltransferase [Paraburkholderia]ORC48754.1 phosphoribosylglycinamide formyltransferase [Burkholderia sp. A27]MDR6409636.1 phosphoribosylglycinamide formyltransferase-1 [Paraburkholderia terricola]MDR6446439.1 phosphoribosylglycinamide formyltransferase-1 [Paraburkholderia terricola]MDR6480524.1 phosphoribosylglycinamide formyltransferase-1 [Paraburkholderia terricola]MDR6491996.1 phosphoribosylglycinamide formyltransferase-1 [Paraburkholderia terr
MKKLVILISGRGSNMEAIVRACSNEAWPAQVAAVIANRPDAAGLAFAASHGIATAVVDHRQFPDRERFDAALAELIDSFSPDLVILAGFMRVLTPGFVDHYAGRMLNVHPSLLPSFPGLKTHQQALDAGVRLHGASVHFVTSQLDHGPIVAQAAVPVQAGDTPAMLAERVLATEHIIYPRAVRWFVEGRLALDGLRVTLTPPEPQWLFAGHTAGEGA